MTQDRRLDGKVAIVTGASAGIGRSTARALAEVGASVVVTARREDRLAQLAKEIKRSGAHRRETSALYCVRAHTK